MQFQYNHLSNQFYQVCIRQEQGRCGVFYLPTSDENSFRLEGIQKSKAGSQKGTCLFDYIIIPAGTSPGLTCIDQGRIAVDSHGILFYENGWLPDTGLTSNNE